MPPQLESFLKQLTADKKKFGLMCMLVAVGLLLWGRLMLLDRVPKTAVADPDTATERASPPAQPVEPSVVYIGRLPDQPTRDIFALPRDRYKPIAPTDNPVNPGKSEVIRVDETPAELQEIRAEARRLRLRAIIYGIRPRVVLNEQMFKSGDYVQGFKVLAIEKNAAVIAKAGYLFRLRVTAEP